MRDWKLNEVREFGERSKFVRLFFNKRIKIEIGIFLFEKEWTYSLGFRKCSTCSTPILPHILERSSKCTACVLRGVLIPSLDCFKPRWPITHSFAIWRKYDYPTKMKEDPKTWPRRQKWFGDLTAKHDRARFHTFCCNFNTVAPKNQFLKTNTIWRERVRVRDKDIVMI